MTNPHDTADPGSAETDTFSELRYVDAGELNVAYLDAGPDDGTPVVLLHGWPYDIRSFGEVVPILTRAGHRVLVPYVRGHGSTTFRSPDIPRRAQQATLALDVIEFLDALGIDRAVIGGFDWGARSANIVAALHPERTIGLVSVSGYLIGSRGAGAVPLPPERELQWWYQYYFATERGRDGYGRFRDDFAKLIWKLASPEWAFTESTFRASAVAFANPDHVDIVIHNYRWRLGLADGDERLDAIEQLLAGAPDITVPTITVEGDANGAPHPDPAAYAAKFTGAYEHRTIVGGIGHNLPQEAPEAFAQAILDVLALAPRHPGKGMNP
jgi:pimeloyl-ACP methyl ester carboxylesterase